jgi:NAD(P)-dependent dehydrogenase (short-subunit alcohol dehydrogenase family)
LVLGHRLGHHRASDRPRLERVRHCPARLVYRALKERGCGLLLLRATDEDPIRRAFDEVGRTEGEVGALVNKAGHNVGYGQYGVVEEVPM